MAEDPYKYFRIEAQELLEGLEQGLLALEKGPDPELVRRVFRQAHTFKGASRVVRRGDIGDLAHQIEELLSGVQDGVTPLSRPLIDKALELLDEMRRKVAELSLDQTAERTKSAGGERPGKQTATTEEQTIRIAVSDLDELLEYAGEAHVAASALQRVSEELSRMCTWARAFGARQRGSAHGSSVEDFDLFARDLDRVRRRLLEATERVMRETAEVSTGVAELRLVPAKVLIAELERVVRDAAHQLGKEAEIRATGTDTHVDARVLGHLHKALVHVVRNSVAHGIEAPLERVRLGKPRVGRIELKIQRRGHRVKLSAQDDGRGLDLDSVRRIAVERGLLSVDDARTLSHANAGSLLLRGGLSTATNVTDVAGRGVGLEAVRTSVETLNGEVSVTSDPGQGTRVDLVVPLSLSAMPALAAHVGRITALLPLDSVRQALRFAHDAVIWSDSGARVVVDGNSIPFLDATTLFGLEGLDPSRMRSALLIEAEGSSVALGVERVGAARSVLVRAIPEHAAEKPFVSGAALNQDGVPELVLSPVALVRQGLVGGAAPVYSPEQVSRPILVIDDSLTTRMLEQSILESAGYEVDLAVSAEEGLQLARRKSYALFIVDVEMPGMNGFEFIATTRNDPDLRETPAVLVTSRADPSDKRRGLEVGARAYVVKSEFDQAKLLDIIRGLVG